MSILLRISVLGLGLLLITATVFSQTQEELSVLSPGVDQPPATLPAECSSALILESDNINGSPSYVRLKKQFKSLELGHRASKELGSAFSARSGSSVGDQLLQINMQMSSSLNGYVCASFLAGTIQVSATALEKEAEATANRTLI